MDCNLENSLELQLPAQFCPVICQSLDYDSRGTQFHLFVTCAHPLALHCPRGISRVEAGAQGMHKLQRGYMPSFTYSSHYIVDESLRGIVGRFLYAELQRTHQNLQVGLLKAMKSQRVTFTYACTLGQNPRKTTLCVPL